MMELGRARNGLARPSEAQHRVEQQRIIAPAAVRLGEQVTKALARRKHRRRSAEDDVLGHLRPPDRRDRGIPADLARNAAFVAQLVKPLWLDGAPA